MYRLVVLCEVEAVAWDALEGVTGRTCIIICMYLHIKHMFFCLSTANTYLLAIHHFSCPTHYDPLGSFVEDDNLQNHRGHSGLPGSFVEDDSLSHTYQENFGQVKTCP